MLGEEAITVQRRYLVLVILGISVVVGLLFAVVSPTGNSEAVFRTLATVQGSFLAIVVSIFILSQQVTASEYTPIALREMRDDPAIDGLILLFIGSILLDIWYHLNIQLELLTFNTELNVEVGTAVGLATLCLLLLMPARRHVIEAVGPENVLDSTVDGIQPKAFPSKKNSGLDSPPERNPLLAIDQVLQSAVSRGDEFTIQRAIYDMHRATKEGIASDEEAMQSVDEEGLFEYWDNCIEIATQGGPKRGEIAARGIRKVTVELIRKDMISHVDGRVKDLNDLFIGLYDESNLSMEVFNEFRHIGREGTQHEEPEIHLILSECYHGQVSHIVNDDREEDDKSQRDDLLREIVFSSLQILIVSSNLDLDYPRVSESTGLEEIIKKQIEMHKIWIEKCTVDDETIGDIADRFAVITSACESANNQEASLIAFTHLVEASLYLGDSGDDVRTRLSDANLPENRQKELAQSKLSGKGDIKPDVEFSNIPHEQYLEVYRTLAPRESSDRRLLFNF